VYNVYFNSEKLQCFNCVLAIVLVVNSRLASFDKNN